MPPAPARPEALRVLGAALGSLRDCARSGADEVLEHLPEVGDRELQTVLDDHLDQVADLLREMEASAADVANRLRVAAARRAASSAATPAGFTAASAAIGPTGTGPTAPPGTGPTGPPGTGTTWPPAPGDLR